MKHKIIKIVKSRHDVPLTMLPELIPEAKGDLAMFATPNKGFNPNVILCRNVNNQFIDIFNELVRENVIKYEPCSLMILMFDGAPIYGDKLCTKRMLKGKTQCWMPIVIKMF